MTDEQRKRLAELVEKQRASEKRKEIRRLEERLTEEIPGFAEKYVFADDDPAEKFGKFTREIHLRFAAPGGIKNFSLRKVYSPEGADVRRVWMEFFLGSRDIFKVYVGGTAADFISDFEDWWLYEPFDVPILDDLSGFLFIDRQQNITEIVI